MSDAVPAAHTIKPPAIDPTKNVLDLVEAAIKRQDDLRDVWIKVFEAELRAVHDRFEAAERQRLENKVDSSAAVAAALAAAKELVIAQATTAGEAMQQQARTTEAALKGISDSLTDLKERVVSIEAVKLGSESHKIDQRQSVGMTVGIAGVGLALVMALIAIATLVLKTNGAG